LPGRRRSSHPHEAGVHDTDSLTNATGHDEAGGQARRPIVR
jgi:hypothetical protein